MFLSSEVHLPIPSPPPAPTYLALLGLWVSKRNTNNGTETLMPEELCLIVSKTGAANEGC